MENFGHTALNCGKDFFLFILGHPVLCSKDNPSTQLLTYVIFLAPLKMVSQGHEHCLVPSFLDIVLIKDEPAHIIYQIIMSKCKTQYNVLEIPFCFFKDINFDPVNQKHTHFQIESFESRQNGYFQILSKWSF